MAERQTARIASVNTRRATKNVREIEKAEKKVRDAGRAQQAERDSTIGQSKPRPKAQIVKWHYKLNERRPGTPAMPPANRGRNADSLWTT